MIDCPVIFLFRTICLQVASQEDVRERPPHQGLHNRQKQPHEKAIQVWSKKDLVKES
jgi:hypothetical protein